MSSRGSSAGIAGYLLVPFFEAVAPSVVATGDDPPALAIGFFGMSNTATIGFTVCVSEKDPSGTYPTAVLTGSVPTGSSPNSQRQLNGGNVRRVQYHRQPGAD